MIHVTGDVCITGTVMHNSIQTLRLPAVTSALLSAESVRIFPNIQNSVNELSILSFRLTPPLLPLLFVG